MRKMMLLILLSCPVQDILADCVFASPDVVDNGLIKGGWHDPVSKTRKHCIWARNKADALVKEYAATVLLDAPVESVVGILMDLKSYRHVFEYVEISDVIDKSAEAGRFFQQLKFPRWMIGIEDRFFTIDIRLETRDQGIKIVNWNQVFSGDLRRGRGLTTLKNEGFWYLKPTADGKQTSVLYYVHANPGGNLPKSLVGFANRRGIPDVFRDIKKALVKHLGR